MLVIYKTYEPNLGYEEIQAKIFNNHLKNSPKNIFLPITAKEIKKRIEFENKDPNLLRYAFAEDNIPVAYIQATVENNTIWIGYPWALENCPKGAQETLYNDLYAYVTHQHPEKEIVMGYFNDSWERQKNFAIEKGFHINDTSLFYTVNSTGIDMEISEGFSIKIGTIDDLDDLLELSISDLGVRQNFGSIEAMKNYFQQILLTDGNVLLVYTKHHILVAAAAPIRGFFKGYMLRFTALRPGFEDSWMFLIGKIIQHCQQLGWKEKLILSTYDKWDVIEPHFKHLKMELMATQVQYKLTRN